MAVIESLIKDYGVAFVAVPQDSPVREAMRFVVAFQPSNPGSVFLIVTNGNSVSWVRAADIVTFLDWTGPDGLDAPTSALPVHVVDRVVLTSDPAPTHEIAEDLTSTEGQVFAIQDDKAQKQVVGVLYSPTLSSGISDFGATNLGSIFGPTPHIVIEKRAKRTKCPNCSETNFPTYERVNRIWICPFCKHSRELR